jgi:peptidoglycan/xylan/chitin deacetylase (PgdA/CDA1 family)
MAGLEKGLSRLSWKRSLVNRLGAKPGLPATAVVYGLGGRFYARWLYSAQGEALEGDHTGRLTVSFDVDYPRDALALGPLCELLDKLGITASFAVVGALVERYPQQHRLLVQAGHELLNHTQNHPDNELFCPERNFDQLSPDEQAQEITLCTKTCNELLGVELKGFRAPHFGNVSSRDFYKLLAEQGYRFSSSLMATETETCGLPFCTAEGVWEFPVSTCPRHPFAVLDSWHALRNPGGRHTKNGQFTELCRESIEMAAEYGGYLNLYFDPGHILEYPQAIEALAELSPQRHGLAALTYAGYLDVLTQSADAGSRN